MGNFIIKADPEEDFYILWSTYTDSPIGYGTRQEFEDWEPETYTDQRFERADRTGTSYLLGCGSWEDDIRLVTGGTKPDHWYIPREHIRQVCVGLVDNDDNREAQQEIIDQYCTAINYDEW
ncbi:hypothetical protein SEA_ATUIN_61 [Arthrobacter phage Atuin]|nr:hypothetical protein SEA_ATUIN_160 [Arthrobacter phage Atuin]